MLLVTTPYHTWVGQSRGRSSRCDGLQHSSASHHGDGHAVAHFRLFCKVPSGPGLSLEEAARPSDVYGGFVWLHRFRQHPKLLIIQFSF